MNRKLIFFFLIIASMGFCKESKKELFEEESKKKSIKELLCFFTKSSWQKKKNIYSVFFEFADLNKDQTITVFLSDGTSWVVESSFSKDLEKWHEGDEIRWKKIYEHCEEGTFSGFALKNLNSNSGVFAKLDNINLSKELLQLKKIDKNGYVLSLSNEDIFYCGWLASFTAHKWRKKDRVVINKSYHCEEDDYEIFNVERNDSVWVSKTSW